MYNVCKLSNEIDFLFTKGFIFSNIHVIPFKIVPLGSYTPMEILFPILEVFNFIMSDTIEETSVLIVLTESAKEQDFFSHVITGDESWIF